MSPKALRRHTASGFAALATTVGLFLLPLFMSGLQADPRPPSEYGAVSLSSTPAPSRDSENDSRETQDRTEPERIQEFAPPTQDMNFTPQQPTAQLDLPEVEFTINPKAATGMALPAPASLSSPAAPAPAALSGGSLSVGELDNSIVPIFSPAPRYPREGRRRRIETTIQAKLHVNEQGNVTRVEVLRGPHADLFAPTVRKTLMRWRFKPGTKNGKRVKWYAIVPLNFNLD